MRGVHQKSIRARRQSDLVGRWLSTWLDRRPTGTSVALGVLSLGILLTSHALLSFSPAFRPLYVVPIWVATRLGGRLSGIVIVALTTTAATIIENQILLGVTGSDIAGFALGCFVSLAFIMFLVARIEASLAEAIHLASRDPLTGVLNRRGLVEEAHRTIKLNDGANPFLAAVIDIDKFKSLNDTHGHAIGDEVLCTLAHVLEESTRSTDLVARLGGDEFCVLLRDISPDDSWRVLYRVEERFHAQVAQQGYPCTLSIGLAGVGMNTMGIEETLHVADRLMYSRKLSRKAAVQLEMGPEGILPRDRST